MTFVTVPTCSPKHWAKSRYERDRSSRKILTVALTEDLTRSLPLPCCFARYRIIYNTLRGGSTKISNFFLLPPPKRNMVCK